MSNTTERTTVYLNPYVKKYLKYRSLQENRSISDIVNDEFADALEDLEDAAELARRAGKPEFVPWEAVKAELQKDGKL